MTALHCGLLAMSMAISTTVSVPLTISIWIGHHFVPERIFAIDHGSTSCQTSSEGYLPEREGSYNEKTMMAAH